ncbi:MAG TPA: hypothetical protein VFT10_09215 [Solirubrobacterales bacterium]|nr:hypothetical protein [Solirubrobacterales bacterium]
MLSPVAFVVTALLASTALAAPAETQVASCARGPVTAGSGPSDWPRGTWTAGPLGVFRQPLSHMEETSSGQLIAKMPVIVEGSTPVKLSVPTRLRQRVFLYYGRFLDRSGNPTTQIGKSRGFSEIVFEPCGDRPLTAWPGGIRVKGRGAVRLTVRVEGDPEPVPLSLGKPRPHRSAPR